MAMQLFSVEEFEGELNRRGCRKIKDIKNGYSLWANEREEVFSVPPPEELASGEFKYPDYLLDDLIEEMGLPEGPSCH